MTRSHQIVTEEEERFGQKNSSIRKCGQLVENRKLREAPAKRVVVGIVKDNPKRTKKGGRIGKAMVRILEMTCDCRARQRKKMEEGVNTRKVSGESEKN